MLFRSGRTEEPATRTQGRVKSHLCQNLQNLNLGCAVLGPRAGARTESATAGREGPSPRSTQRKPAGADSRVGASRSRRQALPSPGESRRAPQDATQLPAAPRGWRTLPARSPRRTKVLWSPSLVTGPVALEGRLRSEHPRLRPKMPHWKPLPRGSAAGPSRPGRMPGGSGRPSQTGTPKRMVLDGSGAQPAPTREGPSRSRRDPGTVRRQEAAAGVACGKQRPRRHRLAETVPLPGLR